MKNLYLNNTQLKYELDKCLNCKSKPCMEACPVNCCPQEFIQYAKNGDYDKAIEVIFRQNPMGQTCGLICPDNFCMKACLRAKIDAPVNIPKVQASLFHKFRTEHNCKLAKNNGKKIAIIGAGPAGAGAAHKLLKKGYMIDIFERSNDLGGALNLIPDYRLPKEVIKKDWGYAKNVSHINLNFNSDIKDEAELLKDYDAVIVATGEPHVINLDIKGEESAVSYMDYLRNPALYKYAQNIAIIGGGRVAVDCAITARKNGSLENVELFVRRGLSDMRITQHEYLELLKYKINVSTMIRVGAIKKEKDLLSLDTIKTEFEDNKLVDVANSKVIRKNFDLVIKAIGSYSIKKSDEDKIIYAGDCKTGGSTIVEALASGQKAAMQIDKILNHKGESK